MSSSYTHEERYKIIRYILDNEILSGLKENAVWKDMEEAKIINRSWHSMKKQFKGTIINMLHLFDITDDQRKQVLIGSGTKMKMHTSEFEGAVLGNRKRLSPGSDSDSDTTTNLSEENSNFDKRPKTDSKTSTSPEEGSKSDSESSSSLDLLFPVKTSCTSTCTTKSNECSSKELKSQEHQVDDSNEQINVVSNNEFTADTDSVQENPFSLEEDTELILFFKSHEQFVRKIHDETVYKAFQIKTSSIRSCETLEDRFVNHIIPNLFNYKCLTYDEMIVLYDCWDLDIPEELQLRIRQVVAEPRTGTKKVGTDKTTVDKEIQSRIRQVIAEPRTKNKKVCTCKTTVNKGTQTSLPAYQNTECILYREGKYIGWLDHGVKHIFIPNIDKDHNKKKREIHDHIIIADQNIHFVSMQVFSSMNDIINNDVEFISLCDDFLKTGEFNTVLLKPVLDKMKQVNIDFTGNNKTVCNVKSEKET